MRALRLFEPLKSSHGDGMSALVEVMHVRGDARFVEDGLEVLPRRVSGKQTRHL